LEDLSIMASRYPDSRPGANAGDLQWLIPTGMAHQNPNSRHIALFLALDNHGIPHLFLAKSADALTDPHRDAVCPRPEGAYRASGGVNLKRASVLWFQYVWHASVLSLQPHGFVCTSIRNEFSL
jgi:hypothetical protein